MVNRSFAVVAGFILAVMLILSIPVSAADPVPQVGVVDVYEISQKYEKMKSFDSELDAFRQQLLTKIQTRDEHRLLSDAEINELLTLVAKPNQTDADKARIKALGEREKALDEELKDLQNKKELTDTEKARLTELTNILNKADEAVMALSEEANQQFEAKSRELNEQIRTTVLKAIETVAKAKKLSMVVDKMVVLTGGMDITADVIKELNK
ncbi:MAG TPA: OmpH family outer membrane protein [Armatimonadota bacterium]|nr:OmpH family outer membrane protein [Armatimonadota bacterium]HOP79983.1 OmpH family outer membrane protein [Armatimonadota bacterium]